MTGKRRFGRVLLAVGTVLACVTACGGGGSEDVTATSADEGFRLEQRGDAQAVLGRGLFFVVPDSWRPSEDEKLSSSGDSMEWAVEAPSPQDPFVPYVSISAGIEKEATTTVQAAVDGFKGIQTLNDTYELLDEGEIDVPGAKSAYQLHARYETDLTLEGQDLPVRTRIETRVVFLGLPGGQLTTFRLIAPEAHWGEADLDDVLDTLEVAQTEA